VISGGNAMKIFFPVLIFLSLTAGCTDSLDNGIPENINDDVNTVVVNSRVFYYRAPETVPPPGGHPVVLCFHGGDGYAQNWMDLSGIGLSAFGNMAMGRGYFVIAPESGVSDDPSGSFNDVKKRWDTSIASRDIDFVLDIIDWLGHSNYQVNVNRIFLVGISSGGAMISRLCQSVPGFFNRVAIAASINPTYGYFNVAQTVAASHPSVLFVHGTADTLTPYNLMLNYYSAIPHGDPNGQGTYTIGDSDGVAQAKELITITGGIHTWYRDYNDEILDWFDGAP
jgi:poly(3-hydroxybutyrate) depolymerase